MGVLSYNFKFNYSEVIYKALDFYVNGKYMRLIYKYLGGMRKVVRRES